MEFVLKLFFIVITYHRMWSLNYTQLGILYFTLSKCTHKYLRKNFNNTINCLNSVWQAPGVGAWRMGLKHGSPVEAWVPCPQWWMMTKQPLIKAMMTWRNDSNKTKYKTCIFFLGGEGWGCWEGLFGGGGVTALSIFLWVLCNRISVDIRFSCGLSVFKSKLKTCLEYLPTLNSQIH